MRTPDIFHIKQGNTSPLFRRTLLDGDEEAIDLTGAAVFASMRMRTDGSIVFYRRACSIIGTATDGVVQYSWQEGDTAADGKADFEFVIVYENDREESVPNSGMVEVRIAESIPSE
ncbi:MAG: hypothetical protein V4747_11525 [Pseudomonadota bacterium]